MARIGVVGRIKGFGTTDYDYIAGSRLDVAKKWAQDCRELNAARFHGTTDFRLRIH